MYDSVGFGHSFRDKSPFAQLSSPSSSDSSLSLRSTISRLTVFVKALDEPVVNAPRLQEDSVNIHLFLNKGDVEILKINTVSLKLLYGSSPKLLFCVTAGDDSNGEFYSEDGLIPLLSLANSELHIALPCTKVWLHLFAWSKVISALVSLGTSSPATYASAISVTPSSDQHLLQDDGQCSVAHSRLGLGAKSLLSTRERLSDGGIIDTGDAAVNGGVDFVSNFSGDPSATHDDKRWPVQLKVANLNVVFILPDYVVESKSDHQHPTLKWKQNGPKVLWTGLRNIIEDISLKNKVEEIPDGERSTGKQIVLSWTMRIDEIQANRGGLCTLSACIMHAEAAIEEDFAEGRSFHMHFLQATAIGIKGQINPEHSLKNAAFSIEVDSVDVWCSYTILHFLNRFHLEQLKTGSSSSATEIYCSLKVRLQSCSLLLSDSRWSCNAPILEVVLKRVLAQVVCKRFDVEASLSSEVEIHYHNIQKVAWEPFVEPWSVCSKLSRAFQSSTTSSSRPFRTKFELTSSAPLNVNVTESLIQAISRAVEMFSDSWKNRSGDDASADFKIRDPQCTESSSMGRYAPYWLQNDTGVPLSYWLCEASRNKENDDDASSFGSTRSSWGSLVYNVLVATCYRLSLWYTMSETRKCTLSLVMVLSVPAV